MAGVVLIDGSDMDIVSFDDSEQFEEEDSVCSWISDSDLVLNWSGWKRSSPTFDSTDNEDFDQVTSLIQICAKCVAKHYPFEIVETYEPPIPADLQLKIAYWSFPGNEEEIRLYSCLASGSNEKFKLGDFLMRSENVEDVLQIGFHLSGVVTQPVSHTPAKQIYHVAISFDRGHITSCQCTCSENATWCEHATAVCLYRIHHKNNVSMRAPVSESLNRLERDQLQKFAQYLISELPQQLLPTAQRLLDELLSSKQSQINLTDGAPDPTAGASISEEAKWVLDELSLRENIKKVLGRFCGVLPLVMDINSAFLTSSAPPVSVEWSRAIKSFQGREPEPIWNLFSIVRHMFTRDDSNAMVLLQFVTEECLLCYQMMYYWLSSHHSIQANNGQRFRQDLHSSYAANDISRHSTTHLMDEVVHLWELAAMKPYLEETAKRNLKTKFYTWASQVVEAAKKGFGQGKLTSHQLKIFSEFTGFNPAITACDMNWNVFYEILALSQKSLMEFSNTRSFEESDTSDDIMERMYNEITTLLPSHMDEFLLVNKLTQALCCHGYANKSVKLAAVLARKIVASFPDMVNAGVINFSFVTEKAKDVCEMLTNSPEYEKLAFEIAILGLTVPRLPAPSNVEEVRLTYLEMFLHTKLNEMLVNEERLVFVRYQAHKLLANPMLRGDGVLALLMATYIFEVLCRQNVSGTPSCKNEVCKRMNGDDSLGYKAALVSLGLCSNVVDKKQPMLCESIRHQRRDLALALLTHCRSNEEKVIEILSVLLDKERYSFMSSCHTGNNTKIWKNVKETRTSKKKVETTKNSGSSSQSRGGFTFADIRMNLGKTMPSERNAPPKNSSDSDSGHGEGGNKRISSRNLPLPIGMNRKTQHQRRHSRQISKNRSDKNVRNERSWTKHNKGARPRKLSKNRTSREMTESDSGQEMHFSFEGGTAWSKQNENWDDEIDRENTVSRSLAANYTSTNTECKNSSSGGGSSLSSIENLPNHNQVSTSSNVSFPQNDLLMNINLPNVVDVPCDMSGDVDAGFEEDFNITPSLFQRNIAVTEHIPSVDVTTEESIMKSSENTADSVEIVTVGRVNKTSRCEIAKDNVTEEEKDICREEQRETDNPNDEDVLERFNLLNMNEGIVEDFRSEDESIAPCIDTLEQKVNGLLLNMNSINEQKPATIEQPAAGNFPTVWSHSSSVEESSGDQIEAGENPVEEAGMQEEGLEIQSEQKQSTKKIIDVDDLKQALSHVPAAQIISSSNTTGSSNSQSPKPKPKKNKNKKNRKLKLTMNMQSIESEAYSLFELAKSVLSHARNAGVFSTDVDEVSVNTGVNRRLQLAAFRIGLFALNMHNYSSPNWFSRTYSPYVSWIESQTMDIGTAALRVLNDKWEGVLTPTESIQIASRASRLGDSLLKRTAAELALSCLCYAESLSSADISHTITMCREQDRDLLERACVTVENAGRNGGVQPELFFQIAREWHQLYEDSRTENESDDSASGGTRNTRPSVTSNVSNVGESDVSLFMTPEQFVQEQMHLQAQEMSGRQLPRSSSQDFARIYPPYYGVLHHCPLPQQAIHSRRIHNIDNYSLPLTNYHDDLNLSDIPRYLQNAYRVGMRALEALKSRMHDDRPDVKYAIAPPSSSDIRWMCFLAASLGQPYLKNFCKTVFDAVTSPYLLHDLALEAARHFSMFNPAQLASYLRSPSVSPLVHKSLRMYKELLRHNLELLNTTMYDELVDLLRRMRSAFCMAPAGMASFNEILELVRKTYPKKKDLWRKIMDGLSKA